MFETTPSRIVKNYLSPFLDARLNTSFVASNISSFFESNLARPSAETFNDRSPDMDPEMDQELDFGGYGPVLLSFSRNKFLNIIPCCEEHSRLGGAMAPWPPSRSTPGDLICNILHASTLSLNFHSMMDFHKRGGVFKLLLEKEAFIFSTIKGSMNARLELVGLSTANKFKSQCSRATSLTSFGSSFM